MVEIATRGVTHQVLCFVGSDASDAIFGKVPHERIQEKVSGNWRHLCHCIEPIGLNASPEVTAVTPKRAKTTFDRGNLEAAGLILADAERYGGPDSLLCLWARQWMERHASKQGQYALFGPGSAGRDGENVLKHPECP